MTLSPPRVTAILLTFDCERFAARALAGVLAQDCEPMEILVSDDASGDGTFAVLEREIRRYAGPHSVTLRRREKNSGTKSAHLVDAVRHTRGEIVVSFDGDDVYEPRRVSRLLEQFDADPTTFAVYSHYALIDEEGRSLGRGKVPHPPADGDAGTWFARVDAYAAGSTLAVRRAVYESFEPLVPDVHEDVVLPFRASLLGNVRYVDETLVHARRHAASLTADDARFAGVEAYRRRMVWGIEKARRNHATRIVDLERALVLHPERRARYESLRSVADTSLRHAELTADLVHPSVIARWRAFLRVVHSGAYRDEIGQNLALVVAPGRYLAHKRRQLGIR